MRITDLIDKRSICLDGTPHTKAEALDQMVALMRPAEKSQMRRATENRFISEKRKVPQALEAELPFPTENAPQSANLDWPLWSSGTAWNLNPWTVCRLI